MTVSPRFMAFIAPLVYLFLASGCASDPRAVVMGSVRYAGEPIEDGGIAFLPLEQGEGQNVERRTGEIRDGRYQMEGSRGPLPGKYRVEIFGRKKTGKQVPGEGKRLTDEIIQVIPSKYNTESKLTADVKPGRNTLDFDLEK